jgi:hypothetical protein
MNYKEWKAKAFHEYLRLTKEDRHMAEMWFDYADDLLKLLHTEGVDPIQAGKELTYMETPD